MRAGVSFNASDGLRDIIASLENPLLCDLVDRIFERLANLNHKPRWGDKTPHHVRELVRLGKAFPKAKFIHIMRDGRDVSSSLRKKRWYGPTIHAAWIWAESVRAGRLAGQALGSDRYIEIRYEDLIVNTEATLWREGLLGCRERSSKASTSLLRSGICKKSYQLAI